MNYKILRMVHIEISQAIVECVVASQKRTHFTTRFEKTENRTFTLKTKGIGRIFTDAFL